MAREKYLRIISREDFENPLVLSSTGKSSEENQLEELK